MARDDDEWVATHIGRGMLPFSLQNHLKTAAPRPSHTTMSEIPDISDSPPTSAAGIIGGIAAIHLSDPAEEEIPDMDDIPDMDEAEGLEEGEDDAAVRIVHPSA